MKACRLRTSGNSWSWGVSSFERISTISRNYSISRGVPAANPPIYGGHVRVQAKARSLKLRVGSRFIIASAASMRRRPHELLLVEGVTTLSGGRRSSGH